MGSTYTHSGVEYYHAGIKAVLSSYVYGRYIMFGDIIDNPFGATFKTNNNSERIDFATKKSTYNNERNFAYNIWVDVRKFLIMTEEPLYKHLCQKPKGQMKLRKIGKNTNKNRYGYRDKYR